MRLMCYLAFGLAAVLIFMDGCDADFGNAMSGGSSINEYVMYLLGAAFGGKTLQKFAESFLAGRSPANLVDGGADEQGGKTKRKGKKG